MLRPCPDQLPLVAQLQFAQLTAVSIQSGPSRSARSMQVLFARGLLHLNVLFDDTLVDVRFSGCLSCKRGSL